MNGRNRTSRPAALEEPIRLSYRPPAEYGLKLELFRMSELRQRDEADTLRRAQRIEFCLLMAMIRGRCTHWVDFVPAQCTPGTWVLVLDTLRVCSRHLRGLSTPPFSEVPYARTQLSA